MAGFEFGQSSASRLPIGILGALGIKTLGRYPTTLREDYQAILDVLDWIHGSNYTSSRVTGIAIDAATLGNNLHTDPGFIVPTSEVWYVPARCYCAAFNPIAADFSVALYMVMSGGVTNDPGARFLTDSVFYEFLDYTVNGRPALSNPQPFFAPPGSQLGWRNALGAVGPSATAAFTLQALRMPA
jgi:hypothetical protein